MANIVTKKDGTNVPFDQEKLKTAIAGAATEAGLSEQEAANVAAEISGLVVMAFESQDTVSTTEIRDKALTELDEKYPAVAASWRKYEESKV